MKDNKILEFPKSRIVRSAPEILDSMAKKGKSVAAEEMASFFSENIHDMFMSNGIEANEVFETRDFAFIYESVRAMCMRQFGITHPLHELIDNSHILAKEEIDSDGTD